MKNLGLFYNNFNSEKKYSSRSVSLYLNAFYDSAYGRFIIPAEIHNRLIGGISMIHSGNTSQRPSSACVGQMYFDTSLNKPIWCKKGSLCVVSLIFNVVSIINSNELIITINGTDYNITIDENEDNNSLYEKLVNTLVSDDYFVYRINSNRVYIVSSNNSTDLEVTSNTIEGLEINIKKMLSAQSTEWVDANGNIV